MATLNQLFKVKRIQKRRNSMTHFLRKNPQKRGICLKIYIKKPKKPHSANRKVVRILLFRSKRRVVSYIPGQGHNSAMHSVVLIRGGRVRDLPGIHSKLYRMKYDFTYHESFMRGRRRSKYGYKRVYK